MKRVDGYYTVDEVKDVLGYSKSKAYNIIAQLNKELREKGYLTRPGWVPKKYFKERYGV